MRYVVALGVALVLNACANVLMKLGAKSAAERGGLMQDGLAGALASLGKNGPLLIGLGCFALNALFYIYALQSRSLKISIAYPIMVGGGYALIAIVARVHPALSERLDPTQIVGVLLILTGIVLIAARMDASSAVEV